VVGHDEALQGPRGEVTGREFVTVLEVTDGGFDGIVVRVRSGRRVHPHTVVVGADEQSLATDHLTGERFNADSVQTWTHVSS